MPGFEDFDPTFERGDGVFIVTNVLVGGAIGWFAASWLAGIALVGAWAMLRTLLNWTLDGHLPFLARTMARGEHGAVHPTVAHYLARFLACAFTTTFAALLAAAIHSLF